MSKPISPAIIINESYDVQQTAPTGYNILVNGFTSEGTNNEPYLLNDISEFTSIFGEPNGNRPEQIYAYDAVERVLKSGASVVFTRLPYGKDDGWEVGKTYSALLFPTIKDTTTTKELYSVTLSGDIPKALIMAQPNLAADPALMAGFRAGDVVLSADYKKMADEITSGLAGYSEPMVYNVKDTDGYVFGEPIRVNLNEEGYAKVACGQINWSDSYTSFDKSLSSYDAAEFGKVGMIILDSSGTITPDASSGYYVTATDNSSADPSTTHNCVTDIKTCLSGSSVASTWSRLPPEKFDFELVTPNGETNGSVSYTQNSLAETSTNSPWETGEYANYVNITMWRLIEDTRNGSRQLIPVVVENHVGSVSNSDTTITEGGAKVTDFIQDKVEQTPTARLKVLVNSHIASDEYVNPNGQKSRGVKFWRPDVKDDISSPPSDTDPTADSMFGVSQFVKTVEQKGYDIGNLPKKLRTALRGVDNPDRVSLDVSVEAGLATIWATVNTEPDSWLDGTPATKSFIYDDTAYIDVKADLGKATPEFSETGRLRSLWSEINDEFVNFSRFTRPNNGGIQHLHCADPLRQIFINGIDCKVYNPVTKARTPDLFATYIYQPMKNLTRLINTSVMTIDAQWYKVNNLYTSKPMWVPSSPVVARLFGETALPWQSAAGVARGVVKDVVDIACDPVLRDRDLLWKIHANSVFFDRASSGFLRFADQTQLKNDTIQLRQNSARRLMIWLEKNLSVALRPFLFEPNNFQTRIRFKNTIERYLKVALDNGAIEDYNVVVSSDVTLQQEGTLMATIAIKITGQVDRIILNFDMLRLDGVFEEII